MKIGDRIYVRGYVDEISKDTVIIRNDGGYFGTVPNEVITGEMPERKKGKWIPVTKIYKVTEEQFPKTHIEWVDATEPDEIDGVRCSECGTVYDFIEARNWCSECGADMRGEQE